MKTAGEILGALAGVALVLTILWDAFETIVLPRRVSRRLRPTRLFYRATWAPWAALARRLPAGSARESILGYFGPLSLIVLLALWAAALVLGFGCIQWGAGSHIQAPAGISGFPADLYVSGTTLSTLGLGDLYPLSASARTLTVIEAGIGLGLLALVIGYLP
ncbi:MAG TPA: potassium channel family protein, partial [Steroidobacteraceae bacterium]|nr:potassium channel family protein [Steroidobacteraceae bacterium]